MPEAGPLGDDAYAVRPPRKRTCLNGKLVYDEGAFALGGALTLDCAIRNISEGGAKVVITEHRPLPANLYLIVVKYCVAYRAKIVWQNFPARGLNFSRKYLLSTTLPEELKFLRGLWVDLTVRSGGEFPW
jgi:hypothetical protein